MERTKARPRDDSHAAFLASETFRTLSAAYSLTRTLRALFYARGDQATISADNQDYAALNVQLKKIEGDTLDHHLEWSLAEKQNLSGCPFCGREPLLYRDGDIYVAECPLHASMRAVSREQVLQLWNWREPRPKAQVNREVAGRLKKAQEALEHAVRYLETEQEMR